MFSRWWEAKEEEKGSQEGENIRDMGTKMEAMGVFERKAALYLPFHNSLSELSKISEYHPTAESNQKGRDEERKEELLSDLVHLEEIKRLLGEMEKAIGEKINQVQKQKERRKEK